MMAPHPFSPRGDRPTTARATPRVIRTRGAYPAESPRESPARTCRPASKTTPSSARGFTSGTAPSQRGNPRFFAEVNVRGFRVFDIELPDNIGVFGGSEELHTTALVAAGWIGWRWFWRNGLSVGIGAELDYPFASWGHCVSVCVLAKRRLDARPFLDVGLAF